MPANIGQDLVCSMRPFGKGWQALQIPDPTVSKAKRLQLLIPWSGVGVPDRLPVQARRLAHEPAFCLSPHRENMESRKTFEPFGLALPECQKELANAAQGAGVGG